LRPDSQIILKTPSPKQPEQNGTGGVAQTAEHLLCKRREFKPKSHEKKKKKKEEKKKKKDIQLPGALWLSWVSGLSTQSTYPRDKAHMTLRTQFEIRASE
jgi:hypothetical protein